MKNKQTKEERKKRRKERMEQIIKKVKEDIRRLEFGRIIIYVQDGYAFRSETVESNTGKGNKCFPQIEA